MSIIVENGLVSFVAAIEQSVRSGNKVVLNSPSFNGLLYEATMEKGTPNKLEVSDNEIVVKTPDFQEFCHTIESLVFSGYIVNYEAPIDCMFQYESTLLNTIKKPIKKKGG